METEYARSLSALQAKRPEGDLPEVGVQIRDLTYRVKVPKKAKNESDINNMGKVAFNLLKLPLTIASIPYQIGKKIIAEKRKSKEEKEREEMETSFDVLRDVNLYIKPGTTTLILGPPGSGKSAMLKTIANRVRSEQILPGGGIYYNGEDASKPMHDNANYKLLSTYVDQIDTHLPLLSVRETLQFAHDNSTVDESYLPTDELKEAHKNAVQNVINALHLTGCSETKIGNDMNRGTSGGERKRVTVAEALLSAARVMCMDEISTGLDSPVTYDIIRNLAAWAKITKGSAVISLLQPPPEVYDLFDNILLLREGYVVYHGPRTELPGYLTSLGFDVPQAVNIGVEGAQAGSSVDMADFLISFLNNPRAYAIAANDSDSEDDANNDAASVDSVDDGKYPLFDKDGKRLPTTTKLLVDAWKTSPLGKQDFTLAHDNSLLKPVTLTTPYAKQQYGQLQPRTDMQHFKSIVNRQIQITARNKQFLTIRAVASVLMGFIIGTIFYQLDITKIGERYGLFLIAALQISFGNFSEAPLILENKLIAYKQMSNGMHKGLPYVLAQSLMHLPIAIIETGILSVMVYFLTGLYYTSSDVGHFFFFWLVVLLSDILIATFFRFIALSVPTLEQVQMVPTPIIALFVLFCGFLITRDKMGWLIFVHYISAFAWTLRSLAQNEFLSPKYDAQVPLNAANPQAGTIRLGNLYLEAFGMQSEEIWKWMGVLYGAVFIILCLFLAVCAIDRSKMDRNIGSRRILSEDEVEVAKSDADKTALAIDNGKAAVSTPSKKEKTSSVSPSPTPETTEVVVNPATTNTSATAATSEYTTVGKEVVEMVSNPLASGKSATPSTSTAVTPATATAASALPFEPMTLGFKDIKYTVKVINQTTQQPEDKVILNGVSGAAVPGRILALMGASGAGKSSLLDCLAGKKNTGILEGKIYVNGFDKETKSFARICGYVEQQDMHVATATIREALDFSAKMRLPASVAADIRTNFVEETLKLLELDAAADKKVGEPGATDGISVAERKLLTIGCEIVANPALVLCDEPTSGLDSKAAMTVMKAIRRIADSGRTVICTIHQPSSELFFMMDDLLLMARGGYTAYFGPLGVNAETFIEYFRTVPGVPPVVPGLNPSTWALDALAGIGVAASVKAKVHHHHHPGSHHHHKGHPRTSSTGSTGESHPRTASVDENGIAMVPIARKTSDAGEHSAATENAPVAKIFSPKEYGDHFKTTEVYRTSMAFVDKIITPKPNTAPIRFDSVYARNVFVRMWYLFIRTNVGYYRNTNYQGAKLYGLLFVALLYGIVYYKLDVDSSSGVQSIVSALFNTSTFMSFLAAQVFLPVIFKQRPAFYRERASFLYTPFEYIFTIFLAEPFWIAVTLLPSLAIVYFMIGLKSTAYAFFMFFLVVWLQTQVFLSIAMIIGAVAGSYETGATVMGNIFPVFFIFGSLFIPPGSLPEAWKWANIIDPIRYTLSVVVAPQFYGDNVSIPVITSSGVVSMDRYQYISERFDIDYNRMTGDVGILVAYIFSALAVAITVTTFVSHMKR